MNDLRSIAFVIKYDLAGFYQSEFCPGNVFNGFVAIAVVDLVLKLFVLLLDLFYLLL